ncbi:MerR family transcriptional regulator [Micromonosporaceae bacterium Da 78-11]
MAWSTRDIAQLAGTSLRTVRHYHEVGLLELPERRANGYKQYGVTHLVRILHIKRLTELGFSLSQIAGMTETESRPDEALRTLDAELAATIERLQRARLELGLILRESTPTELPSEFTAATAMTHLPNADRSFVTVLSRVLGTQTLQAWADMLQQPVTDRAALQFTHLPADADELTRIDLAQGLVPYIRSLYSEHPAIGITNIGTPHSQQYVEETISEALTQLYNPAQLDVLRRTNLLLTSNKFPEGQEPTE